MQGIFIHSLYTSLYNATIDTIIIEPIIMHIHIYEKSSPYRAIESNKKFKFEKSTTSITYAVPTSAPTTVPTNE